MLPNSILNRITNDETALPWGNNGEWRLIPWKVQGLYR